MEILIRTTSIALLVALAFAWRFGRKDRRHSIALGAAVTLGTMIFLASCTLGNASTNSYSDPVDTTLRLPPAYLPGRDPPGPIRFRVTDEVDRNDRPAELSKFAKRLLEDTRDGNQPITVPKRPVRFRQDATTTLVVSGQLRRDWRLVFQLTLDDMLSKTTPAEGVANLRLVHIRGPQTATELLDYDEEAHKLAIEFMASLETVAEQLITSDTGFMGRIELR